METEQLLELQQVERSEEPAGEEKERRAIQKEKDRERRRLRDRQRRKSMSLEEREIHLARRRRNYQLRRQRAANSKLAIVQQEVLTAAESSVRSDCQARAQALDCEVQFAPNEVNQLQNPSDHLNHGETAWSGQYRYRRVLRLTQMKYLIRLLNCSSEKPCIGSQESGEMTVPNGTPRKGIRLVHLKNLIRMLNSEISTTTEKNDSDKMQGGGEVDESSSMQKENEGSDDRVLWNENAKTIDAIDENEQICADGMCSL